MWRTARHLDQALTGHALTGTDFRVPAHATLDLSGLVVESTIARGKHLLTRIGAEHTLHTHLKMEGSWHLYKPGQPLAATRPTRRGSCCAPSRGGRRLRARRRRGDRPRRRGHGGRAPRPRPARARLGRRGGGTPDPGRPRPGGRRGAARPAQPGRDRQHVQDRAVLPRRRAPVAAGRRRSSPCDRLVRRARLVLDANKERVEQTTTGDTRRGHRTWVYRRDRQPCRRCGTTVRVAEQGPPESGARDVLVPDLPAGGLAESGAAGPGFLRQRRRPRHRAGTRSPCGARRCRRAAKPLPTSSSWMASAASSRATASLTSERIADSGHVEGGADRGEQLGGGLLLAALDLGDVAQADPGVGGDLAQGATLAHPLRAEHLAQQAPEEDHPLLLPLSPVNRPSRPPPGRRVARRRGQRYLSRKTSRGAIPQTRRAAGDHRPGRSPPGRPARPPAPR